MATDNYEYTEKDVEVALHFLTLHASKFATPENAVKVLTYVHEQTKELESTTPGELEELLNELENN